MKIVSKGQDREGRVKTINLRLTEKEFSAINVLCEKGKISRTSYIIQAVLNEKVLTNLDAQAIFQLRKIGNNINQITKQIHIISKFIDKKDHYLPDILKEVESMNEQIRSINEYILGTNHDRKN